MNTVELDPSQPLADPRHEHFAQERALGKPFRESYAAAGFRMNSGNAWRLNTREHVRKRIEWLVSQTAEAMLVTAAGLTEWLLRLARKGEELGGASGISTARAALMDVAKLNGLIIDRLAGPRGGAIPLSLDFAGANAEELEILERFFARKAAAAEPANDKAA